MEVAYLKAAMHWISLILALAGHVSFTLSNLVRSRFGLTDGRGSDTPTPANKTDKQTQRYQ